MGQREPWPWPSLPSLHYYVRRFYCESSPALKGQSRTMPTKRTPSKLHADRRSFLQTALIGGAATALTPLHPALGAARANPAPAPAAGNAAAEVKAFELDEITIADLQDGMKSGKFTARSLVEKYSARIEEIDKRGPGINSIIE